MALSRINANSIQDGTVVAADIADGSITTAKIADGNVTNSKIATGTITGDKIGVGQITANLFAAGAVSTTSISNGNSNVTITSANSNVSIFASGTERIRVTTDGNVGIDTTSPSEKLDVIANSSGPDGAIRVRTQSGSGYFGAVGNYPAFGYKTGGVLYAALAYDTNNNFLFTGPESAKQPAYLCRAWVNFNGTGTVAIRASGNVSSITDNGEGQYTVNFSTAMPDADYSASAVISGITAVSDACFVNTDQNNGTRVNPTTSALTLSCYRFQGAVIDPPFVRVTVFR